MSGGPFLRWAGGKTRALPALLPLIPLVIDGVYREIFCGGSAVYFALYERYPTLAHAAVLSDINADLINAYVSVRDDIDNVIGLLGGLSWNDRGNELHREEHYLAVRDDYNKRLHVTTSERAAWFIYLNRTCFNGLHRVNSSGGFNVPWGRLKNPDIIQEPRMRWCSMALQGVQIRREPYDLAMARADSGDIVYCDPPYLDPSPNYFTGYSGKFTSGDAERLSDLAMGAQYRGARVLISNADNELTRHAFEIPRSHPTSYMRVFHSLEVRRSVGASASTRKTAAEIIVECAPCRSVEGLTKP